MIRRRQRSSCWCQRFIHAATLPDDETYANFRKTYCVWVERMTGGKVVEWYMTRGWCCGETNGAVTIYRVKSSWSFSLELSQPRSVRQHRPHSPFRYLCDSFFCILRIRETRVTLEYVPNENIMCRLFLIHPVRLLPTSLFLQQRYF